MERKTFRGIKNKMKKEENFCKTLEVKKTKYNQMLPIGSVKNLTS